MKRFFKKNRDLVNLEDNGQLTLIQESIKKSLLGIRVIIKIYMYGLRTSCTDEHTIVIEHMS